MPCFHPLDAFQCFDGSVVFSQARRFDVVRSLTLPCGQCVGCRLERSRQWAVRCVHEASLFKDNCFVTLTYDNANVPKDNSLLYVDFQLFMKRVRRWFAPVRVRFYMCGEYGEDFGRPHFHALLFGVDFRDKVYLYKSKASGGSKLYSSAMLSELWSLGFSSLGDVTFQSAAYVARYFMKKVTGRVAEAHYSVLNPLTGEITSRVPEFNRMSLKPGIGADWFKAFSSDVYPHGEVVVNGVECKPPRYYDKLFSRVDAGLFDALSFSRELDAKSRSQDCTPERLVVKEQVALARVSRLVRTI